MSADLLDTNALLSSLIGGGMALAGVCLAHWLQKMDAKERDAEHIYGLLQAFHDEIETLWGVYQAAPGDHIAALGNDEPMLVHWPLTLEYFTVYNTNAASIGRIRNHELRKQIIATYTKACSMMDSIRLNNDLVQKWEREQSLFQKTNDPVYALNAKALLERLIEYAAELKKSHSQLDLMASALLQHLRENPHGLP